MLINVPCEGTKKKEKARERRMLKRMIKQEKDPRDLEAFEETFL